MKKSNQLTAKAIAGLKPKEKRYSVSDGDGLFLKVQPTGVKSWVVRICHDSRVTDVALGHWPDLSLKHARQAAREKKVEFGFRPEKKGFVFNDAFRLWCRLKKGNIVSYESEKRRIELYLLEKLGNRPIEEITAPVVIQTVRHLERSGKQVTLKRIVMRVREILDLAVCAGYIKSNPCAKLNRIFSPAKVVPMPAIDWRELPDAFRIVKESADDFTRTMFRFSLATMLRPGEVSKMRWGWIDGKTITIPADEMKMARPHRIPITPYLEEILEDAKRFSRHPKSAFVFTAKHSAKHVNKQHVAKFLHSTELQGRLVAHGLRSIARSWLADHGVSYEVAEACLSHVVGSQVSRAYQRSDYLDARKKVMLRWHDFLAGCED